MIFTWWTDAHLADVPPSMRKEDYSEEILSKINQIANISNKVNADFSIFGGDFFHSKLASKVSHSLVNRALKVLDEFPCPILWILGSHDISYGRVETLNKRPIGTILKHPNVTYMDKPYQVDSVPVPMPNENGGLRIRFLPVSDTYNKPEEVLQTLNEQLAQSVDHGFIKNGGEYYNIAVLHQPVVKDNKNYPYDVIHADDLLGYADLVLFGHMHNYDGTWTITGSCPDENDRDVDMQTIISNVGSISRPSVDDVNREPRMFLFDVSLKGDKPIFSSKELILDHKPATEVFKVEEANKNADIDNQIKGLLDNMKDTSFGLFDKEQAIKSIAEDIMFECFNEHIEPCAEDQAQEFYSKVRDKAVEILRKV